MSRQELIEEVMSGAQREYVLFWRPSDEAGWLSQWYASPFTVDGVRYPTAEHYMMVGKARLFNDSDMIQRIMADESPKSAKRLGRKVAGFDNDVWREHCIDVVVAANLAKFGQNRELYDVLMSTGTSVLVEASPCDRMWGVGKAPWDEAARKPEEWDGENLLGFCIMRVRHLLAKDQVGS
eukprot:jgi/Ulvmu1/11751/UM008_0165.1